MKKLAKNNKYNKNKTQETTQKKKSYNPANRVWGKIIVGFLALAMALSGLITLIWYFTQM